MSNQIVEEYDQIQSEMESIRAEYYKYTAEEDAIVEEQGLKGYILTRPLLGDVLANEFVQSLFPELYDRLKKVDAALAEDAREDGKYIASEEILTIIDNRLNLGEEISSEIYWSNLRDENQDNYIILELLDELEYIME